ncbi:MULTISPECIES: hypothetical protein [unclassified Streptomyces]|uniref:hypothetical protein n=1 Tax=unclassified Streptomyces TaxID=2593676 RepID=UPI002E1CC828|nr:hypothetical protein OG217_01735 [Streptomyces sp. NBC_01023]
MRSIHALLGTAALGAAVLLTAPSAHAAVAQAPQTGAACSKATSDAQKAEAEYQAALKDYKDRTANGGHPGRAEQDNVDKLQSNANALASDAARDCPDAKMPSGTMHAGSGSTSQGVNSTDIALGAGLLAAVAACSLLLRRRGDSRP